MQRLKGSSSKIQKLLQDNIHWSECDWTNVKTILHAARKECNWSSTEMLPLVFGRWRDVTPIGKEIDTTALR